MRDMRYYFPPLNKLFRSFRIRSKEFLRENTLHGFPYFVNPRRPLWERIFWFIATLTSIGSAIGIIITIYNTFQSEPTLTGLDSDTEDLVSYFPSLTICSLVPALKLGAYEADSYHYNMMYHWVWTPVTGMEPSMNLVDETYSQFFTRVVPECEEMFENCTYGNIEMPCESLFQKKLINRGVCCFIPANAITKDHGPRKVTFETNVFPISVDILENGEDPPRRRSPLGFVIESGTNLRASIQFTYSTPNVASLSRNQRKCSYSEEDLSYSICIHKCHKAEYIKKCDCLPWFMMIVDGSNECTREQYNCLASIKNDLSRIKCDCYLSCNHTSYNLESIETFNSNRIEISIPNWPAVIYRRETRFGWLDLLVSFGGIAGVFVGYSLLTTVELAYYLSLRAYCGAVLDGSEKTIKIKVKKAKKATRRKVINTVDLKNDYFTYVE